MRERHGYNIVQIFTLAVTKGKCPTQHCVLLELLCVHLPIRVDRRDQDVELAALAALRGLCSLRFPVRVIPEKNKYQLNTDL